MAGWGWRAPVFILVSRGEYLVNLEHKRALGSVSGTAVGGVGDESLDGDKGASHGGGRRQAQRSYCKKRQIIMVMGWGAR